MRSSAATHDQERKLCTIRHRVLAALRACHPKGLTDHEISMRIGVPYRSVRRERWSLFRAGLILREGSYRPTEKGCPATVWMAVPLPSQEANDECAA